VLTGLTDYDVHVLRGRRQRIPGYARADRLEQGVAGWDSGQRRRERQTFALSGWGTKLGVVGACDYGDASGTGTITYADGPTQDFSLGYSDWYSNAPSTGDDIVSTTPYLNTSTGHSTRSVAVYYASVPLQAGKTVQYVTLPTISNGVTSGRSPCTSSAWR